MILNEGDFVLLIHLLLYRLLIFGLYGIFFLFFLLEQKETKIQGQSNRSACLSGICHQCGSLNGRALFF